MSSCRMIVRPMAPATQPHSDCLPPMITIASSRNMSAMLNVSGAM